ncbi:MAG TPA: alpha/beta fold hydrolase [Gemmatimonadaceae bacterium]|nr:alpha/beta fold hydrolase [Gemmatimonadaceae bacterium]
MPTSSGFSSTTTVPLFWCRYGVPGAPPLLVLHGGPGASHDYLLPQMLELAKGHELVFYDQRGGGRSKTDDREPVTWRTQVEDLEALVAELGLEPPAIVGYSWGGLLALLATIERAARGAALPSLLVLIDPAPLTRQYRERFEAEFARRQNGPEIKAMREELAASGLRERDPEGYRQRAFELSVAGYFADPRRARELTPFRVTGRVQQSVWESLGDFDVVGQLRGLRLPALFLHGRQDPIPFESSEDGARALGAPLVVLEDCGHVPYVEQPGALFAEIGAFLATAGERKDMQRRGGH